MADDMTAVELLKLAPRVIDGEKARGVNAVVQYQISEPVHHVFEDGQVTAVEGVHENPNVTVTISDEDLLRLFRGELNPGAALFTGRLRARGDLGLAQRLLGLVNMTALKAIRERPETA